MDGLAALDKMTFLTLDDFGKPDRVLVLDTETTGLFGAPKDLVVDIGICEAVLSTGTVKDIYSSIVGYDVTEWPDEMCHSWIFENTDLTVDMVAAAKPFLQVKQEVAKLLRGEFITCYNVQYDLDKFLYMPPWNLKTTFLEVRDIMFSARDICRLPNVDPRIAEYRYPKLDFAYEKILAGADPAGIHGKQDHRALSDARVASHLMIRMFRDGQYDPTDMKGRHAAQSRFS